VIIRSVTRRVQIDKVLYVGHEGGIACGLKISSHADRAIVVSFDASMLGE
jgi:hypothetical protein